MIEQTTFSYIDYYKENIDKILDNPHALDELRNSFEFIKDQPKAFIDHFFNQQDSELLLGFDFENKTILFNSLTDQSVSLVIYPNKKNTKLNKLFASLIKGKIYFADIEKELINLFKIYFKKIVNNMYQTELEYSNLNQLVLLNSNHFYPFVNKIKLSKSDELFILNKFLNDSDQLFVLIDKLDTINYNFNKIFKRMDIKSILKIYMRQNLSQKHLLEMKIQIIKKFHELIDNDIHSVFYVIDYVVLNHSSILDEFLSILSNTQYKVVNNLNNHFSPKLNNQTLQKLNNFIFIKDSDFNALNLIFIKYHFKNINLYVEKNKIKNVKYLIKSAIIMKQLPKDLIINIIELTPVNRKFLLKS